MTTPTAGPAHTRAHSRGISLPVTRVIVPGEPHTPQDLVDREWLITNGLGGYSSSTIAGVNTRRYHGLLVAALQNPLGRTVMLHLLDDELPPSMLEEFHLDGGLPVWRYRVAEGGARIEKRIAMPHRQNTVVIRYENTGDAVVTLRLSPAAHFRNYEGTLSEDPHEGYAFDAEDDHYLLSAPGYPPMHMRLDRRATFERSERRMDRLEYPVEEARGYPARAALWSPGSFTVEIPSRESLSLIASTEPVEVATAIDPADVFRAERERRVRLVGATNADARDDVGAQLTLAADQFIIKPVGRVRDTIRAMAVGDEIRTIIAGYHWFTDWGRDTMISLEGLTLTTGRHREAGFILRTFAKYVRHGLIPNLFPDGSDHGLYHTADATLWFFHALERYGQVTGYWALLEDILPVMRDIADQHLAGTRFGIGVDPADGLLRQGADGYQLTWMDAKVDGWVVTPRRGKAVEINALWFNALSLLSRWEGDFGSSERARRYGDEAARVRGSFNERFWSDSIGYLLDVVDGPDGDDTACRPNQLLAISLEHAVLDESRWPAVLDVVQRALLTPVGLRSLAKDHPDYKEKYFGDLRTRDAAYHQGTVWAWLIGPWIDAWLRCHPNDRTGARAYLDGFVKHLPEFGVGSIAEIFDAEPPFTPRGCIAQAWSVGEVLRCWVKTA